LVLFSLLLALVVGLPLGIVCFYWPRNGHAVLSVIGVIQTIPSLALLAFLISLFGLIGTIPAIVALFLYALLPIVQSTHAGFSEISSSMRQAATALGLGFRLRLVLIELPLAQTMILSGIKVAAVTSVGTATIAAELLVLPHLPGFLARYPQIEVELFVETALTDLVAVAGDQGEAQVTVDDLMRASLRMRPDRLIVGELRGGETVTFLRAINTGHPGSITTVHANSPQGAFEQIAFMCMQAGLGLGRLETMEYARSMIDVVIQLDRHSGQRGISCVELTNAA
jgi:hypothetical protein